MSLHLCPNITADDMIYPHIGLNVILVTVLGYWKLTDIEYFMTYDYTMRVA